MSLYAITFDGQPDYIEANGYAQAILAWHAAMAQGQGADWEGTEEPEQVVLVSPKAVVRSGEPLNRDWTTSGYSAARVAELEASRERDEAQAESLRSQLAAMTERFDKLTRWILRYAQDAEGQRTINFAPGLIETQRREAGLDPVGRKPPGEAITAPPGIDVDGLASSLISAVSSDGRWSAIGHAVGCVEDRCAPACRMPKRDPNPRPIAVGIEEGDRCNRLDDKDACMGVMRIFRDGDCSCHISAPCSSCTSAGLECDRCGAEVLPKR